MKQTRRQSARLVCVIITAIFLTVTVFAPMEVSAKSISLNAKVTKSNVLTLLKKYDKDGYYLLKETGKHGGNFMQWLDPKQRITDNVEVAVHEQCHDYTHSVKNISKNIRYFIGNKKHYSVKITRIFKTKKTASSIPKKLRTSRYQVYISNPIPYLTSNVQGVYGLMDEFSAYSWDMHNTAALFRYYKGFAATEDTWHNYISKGASSRLAYAEFRYYILNYMLYAKKHHPAIYKGIVGNKNFCKAYKSTEKQFKTSVTSWENSLPKVKKLMQKKGYTVKINTFFWMYAKNGRGTGIGLLDDKYKLLTKEMKQSKYKKMHNALLKGAAKGK